MKTKTALVTGTSSGIGLSLTKKLLDLDYQVIGISRNQNGFFNDKKKYSHIEKDLSDLKKIKEIKSLEKEIESLDLLVLNSGIGMIGFHEELDEEKLISMLNLNFTANILLTKYFLRKIKVNKGKILFISSSTASKSSPLASAYSATKAGISHFADSLFEEVRKYDVKIFTIEADIVNTNFYNESRISVFPNKDSYILPEEISEILEFILKSESSVIKKISIVPQRKRIEKKSREKI